jgi:hypothetical protein
MLTLMTQLSSEPWIEWSCYASRPQNPSVRLGSSATDLKTDFTNYVVLIPAQRILILSGGKIDRLRLFDSMVDRL